MTFKELARGVIIFDKYSRSDDPVQPLDGKLLVRSEPPRDMATDDVDTLQSLGWFWSDECDCWRYLT